MLKGMNKANAGFMVVFSALTLSACGGGSDGDGPDGPDNSATELNPGVYYIGRQLSGGKSEGDSLLSPTGNFLAFFRNESKNKDDKLIVKKSFTFGNLKFDKDGNISSQIKEYVAISGKPWSQAEGTLSGEVTSSEMADLAAKGATSSSTSVLLRNHGPSDVGITIEKISDIYTNNSDNLATIDINVNGEVLGRDQLGCNFTGEVKIPDESINVFEITYKSEGKGCVIPPAENVSEEDRSRTFSGLGTYIPSDEAILFYSQNGTVAWKFKGKRQ